MPSRDIWVSSGPRVYQSATGAWNASRSSSSISISNKPAVPKTANAAPTEAQANKGKQKQPNPHATSPPAPTAQAAQESSQSKGPLGAPALTTNDPQILAEEADDDDISDVSPDEDEPSPIYTTGQEEEFRNVWGHEHL